MRKNPFEKLGITVSLVEGLDDEALVGIVQSQFRELQKLYHPDREGSTEKAAELSEAYSDIKDPRLETFAKAKAEYVRTKGRSKIARELEAQLGAAMVNRKQLAGSFIEYALHFIGLPEGKKEELCKVVDGKFVGTGVFVDNRHNISHHACLEVTVHDLVIAHNSFDQLKLMKSEKTAKYVLRQLRIRDDGTVYEKTGRASDVSYRRTSKQIIGSVPATFDTPNRVNVYSPSLVLHILLGKERVYIGYRGRNTIDEAIDGNKKIIIQRQMPLEDFKEQLLPYLKPYIAPDHCIFTAEMTKAGFAVNIEGKITKIEEIPSGTFYRMQYR